MELDELDLRLLQALVEDPRRSFRSLAGGLDSSVPTVAKRIRRMESLGIIAGYHTEIDPSYLPGTPYLVTARIATTDEGTPIHPEAERAYRLPGGRLTFVVRIQGQALADLDAWCKRSNLEDVNVTPIVAAWAGQRSLADLKRIHLQCHHCRGPIHADAVTATIGGRTHAFCCPLCQDAFARRHEKMAEA